MTSRSSSPHERGVAAEGEVRFDAILGGRESELVELGRRRTQRLRVGEWPEGRSAPQVERRGEPLFGGDRITGGEGGAPLGDQALAAPCVELVGLDSQQVAGSAGEQHAVLPSAESIRFEHPSEVLDVGVQGCHGARRWIAAPEVVDDSARRHHDVGVDQQIGQDGGFAGRTQCDWLVRGQ